jgi:phospholipid/cholesterol/gamma-HCH transport system substrate-binding protein
VRRLVAVSTALAALVLSAAVSGCSGGSGQPGEGRVAAVFDSVTSLVEGQDVTVAGVPVGSVETIELTSAEKALVTMRVEPRFARFYADASCTLGNKFLLGERFVICDPGRPGAGPLRKRDGVRTVGLARTSSPVEGDLVLSFATLPYRQRLQLLLSELGIAVAGRGEDINAVIRRAAPALRDTRRVLAILAAQRAELGRAIESTDRVLASLAARPERLTGFVEAAAQVSSRLAAHRGELGESVRRLPGLLREAGPALADLDALALDATPLVRSLERSAPSLRRLIGDLEPFSSAALPAVRSLAAVAPVARNALHTAAPAIEELVPVAARLRRVAPLLDTLTRSLESSGVPRGLLHFIFYAVRASARFDSTSHILPARGALSPCSPYNTGPPVESCAALFGDFATAGPADRRGARAKPERRPEPGGGEQAPAPLAPAPSPPQSPPPVPGGPQPPQPPALPELPPLPGQPDGGGPAGDLLDYLLGP